MTPPRFTLCLTFLILGELAKTTDQTSFSSVHQESGFISADVGDDVTLSCFCEGDVAAKFFWYKQTLGQKPKLISTYYKNGMNVKFYDEFKNDTRFTVDSTVGHNHLKITDLRVSDSATYYCACGYSYRFELMEGTTLSVRGSGLNFQLLVNQSESETIQPGGSVTLSCTVQTETCNEEHSVYWFKNSEESQPGLIHIQGGRKDQCERKPNQQSCNYNLPIKILNHSHAGTYYCAVVSCGHILFGNGTKVVMKEEPYPLILVHVLSGALIFTTIMTVSLATYIGVNKKYRCKCKESSEGQSASSTTDNQGDHNEENIHYTALREHRINRPRRQDNNVRSEYEEGSPGLVYLLSALLTITTILVVSLAVSVFKKIYNNNCTCTESQPGCSAPSTEGHRDMENLHYAALSVVQHDRSRRQGNSTKSECVYSSVKL